MCSVACILKVCVGSQPVLGLVYVLVGQNSSAPTYHVLPVLCTSQLAASELLAGVLSCFGLFKCAYIFVRVFGAHLHIRRSMLSLKGFFVVRLCVHSFCDCSSQLILSSSI